MTTTVLPAKFKSPILSPSIHEGLVARHFKNGEDDSVLQALYDGVKALRETCSKATETTATVLGNTMETPASNHRSAREASFKLIGHATQLIDDAVAAAKADIAAIAEKARAPKRNLNAADELRGQFLLTRLAAKAPAERQQIIDQSLAGDEALVGTLLNCEAWVSGLTPTELELLRHRWATKHFAKDLERSSRLEKAVGDTMRAGGLAIQFVDHLTDPKLVAEGEAAAKAASAALKALAS